jgi:hypothetical protein
LHEALEDQVIVVAFVERGLELIDHFRGGLAADVVAFEEDLSASAGAHHAMAEVAETGVGGGSGGHEKENGSGEK